MKDSSPLFYFQIEKILNFYSAKIPAVKSTVFSYFFLKTARFLTFFLAFSENYGLLYSLLPKRI